MCFLSLLLLGSEESVISTSLLLSACGAAALVPAAAVEVDSALLDVSALLPFLPLFLYWASLSSCPKLQWM